MKRFAGDRFTCLSTDVPNRPADVLSGAYVTELDTGNSFAYDGTVWREPPSSPTTLSGQSDTNFTALATGDLIRFDGTDWLNEPLSGLNIAWNQITSVPSTFAPSAHNHSAGEITSGAFANARISEASVIQHVAAIDHDGLLNYVANEHIDHSAIAMRTESWSGLKGGGSIDNNRNLALDINNLVAIGTLSGGINGSTSLFGGYHAFTGTHFKISPNDLIVPANVSGSSKTGSDLRFVTGTAGVNNSLAIWNTDGDVVSTGVAISSLVLDSTIGANSGIAPLDSSGLIPEIHLPPLAIVRTRAVADIAARNALTPVEEGDVAIVADASADPDVDSGGSTYIRTDTSTWLRFKTPDAAVSLSAPPLNRIAYGNGSGNISSDSALEWNPTAHLLEIDGGIRLKAGATVVTPAGDESLSYVTTEVVGPDTITRVMTRLGSGEDVIFASYVVPESTVPPPPPDSDS